MFCLHCHMFTRFWAHWVETCHCAEFRFFGTEEASNWSTWRLFEFTERFFFVSSNHWPGSLSTVELYYTITAEHYGNCDCRNWWKDWAALSCHWPRIDWLPTGKIQPTGGKHIESARTGLRECFSHWTVGTNSGWVWGCGDQRLTVGHPSCHCCEDPLWDTEEHALSQEWLPSTAVPGSMTDGLYGIRYAIPGPDSPRNCFSLAALHSRRCQNWHARKIAETLFPNCKMPHSSYTLAEFNCYGNCGPDTVEILTGLQRWCGHHWSDCTEYVLCDLTEHCQEDLGHWNDSCGTVHQ